MKKGSVHEFLKHAVVRWEALTSDWVRFSINDLIWDSTNLVLAASAINSSPKRWNTSRYNFAYIMQLPKHSPERAHSKVSGDVIVETKLIRAFSFFFGRFEKLLKSSLLASEWKLGKGVYENIQRYKWNRVECCEASDVGTDGILSLIKHLHKMKFS